MGWWRRNEIVRRLGSVEEQILHDRAEMEAEVRTRRLVVVDDQRRERVTVDAEDAVSSVRISMPGEVYGELVLELFVAEDVGDGNPEAGLVVYRAGEVVAHWRVG